jgi:hypothetical protein
MTENPERVRYREAYPRFDMVRAKAAIEAGAEICQFTDNLGRTVGHAQMAGVNDTHFTLEYQFASPLFPVTYNTIDLQMSLTPNKVDINRTNILCPKCGTRKSIIIFNGIWGCDSCLKLLYRSQCVSKNTILWERMNELKKEVGYGRPKGIHRATYVRLRKKYVGLREQLKGAAAPEAGDGHSYIVVANWRKSVPDDEWAFMGPKDGETY